MHLCVFNYECCLTCSPSGMISVREAVVSFLNFMCTRSQKRNEVKHEARHWSRMLSCRVERTNSRFSEFDSASLTKMLVLEAHIFLLCMLALL